MKKCTKCKKEKSLSEFNNHAGHKDGYQGICRICGNKSSLQNYRENKTRYKESAIKRRTNLKNWLKGIKSESSCKNCKVSHPAVLDFHHLDPTKKEISISQAVTVRGWAQEKILYEMKKCEVLCSNCHRILEWNKRYKING